MPNEEEYQNKPQHFVVMEQEILCRKDLSMMAKFVYARMSGFKEFWESPEKTGAFFGRSAKSVIGARQELEKKGLIKCVRNTGRGKAYRVVRLLENEQSDYQDFSSQTTEKLVAYNKVESKAKNKVYSEQEKEALSLSEYLRRKIVENFPNNRAGKDLRVVEKWAIDIEKMIRIDGRKPEQILGAINFAMSDNFWKRIIWSGANLRKHYDRLDADAISKFMKNGTIVI